MLRLAFLGTLLSGVLASAFLTACASPRPVEVLGITVDAEDETTPEELAEARARWDAAGPDRYRFVYEVSCFCPEEIRGPFTLTVHDGDVTAAQFQDRAMDPADPNYRTVDELFDLLALAFDRDAASVRVTYDAALGYPVSAYVDYEAMAADDEMAFFVRDLVRR